MQHKFHRAFKKKSLKQGRKTVQPGLDLNTPPQGPSISVPNSTNPTQSQTNSNSINRELEKPEQNDKSSFVQPLGLAGLWIGALAGGWFAGLANMPVIMCSALGLSSLGCAAGQAIDRSYERERFFSNSKDKFADETKKENTNSSSQECRN